MSAAHDTVACPVCRTELSLEQITAHIDDERAFARMIALRVPAPTHVMGYISLFTPPRQALTLRKKVRLIQQLLPDLLREAITHKGRDWPAPMAAWEQAFEQMLTARAAGRLQLPMTGRATVQVAGQTLAIGDALQQVYGDRDPELAKAERAAREAAPMPQAAREQLARLKGGR